LNSFLTCQENTYIYCDGNGINLIAWEAAITAFSAKQQHLQSEWQQLPLTQHQLNLLLGGNPDHFLGSHGFLMPCQQHFGMFAEAAITQVPN